MHLVLNCKYVMLGMSLIAATVVLQTSSKLLLLGAKARSTSLNQCIPKSSGPLHSARKVNEARGNQLLGKVNFSLVFLNSSVLRKTSYPLTSE